MEQVLQGCEYLRAFDYFQAEPQRYEEEQVRYH